MRGLAVFLGFLLAAGSCLSSRAQAFDEDAQLQDSTRQLAAVISDPFEKMHLLSAPIHVNWSARVDRPRSRGALIVFSLEGPYNGNSYFFYVAHFERRQFEEISAGGQRREWASYYLTDFAQIGEKFWRIPVWDSAQAAADGVKIEMQDWRSGDAGCCPTGKSGIRLDIDRRGRLAVTDIPLQ